MIIPAIYLCCALFAAAIVIGACASAKHADHKIARLREQGRQLDSLRIRSTVHPSPERSARSESSSDVSYLSDSDCIALIESQVANRKSKFQNP